MPQIVLDGTGPTKASLVEGAYSICGLNGFEYERTPEEMIAGLIALNDLAAEWLADGIDLGFDRPTYGNGLLEEPSGIPPSAARVVKYMLAQALCPELGASLSDDARAALSKSYQALRSRLAATPPSRAQVYSPRWSGNRHLRTVAVDPVDPDLDPGDLAAIVSG